METHCTSLAEVREHIDLIDRQIIALLARRGNLVTQAAAFKRNSDEVRAPARVEQVIARTLAVAAQVGADPRVVEATYRSMITAFIDAELTEHATLGATSADATSESPQGCAT